MRVHIGATKNEPSVLVFWHIALRYCKFDVVERFVATRSQLRLIRVQILGDRVSLRVTLVSSLRGVRERR